MKILLKNLKIANHNNVVEGSILIENDKIAGIITDGSSVTADEEYSFNGEYALPGLIDMHAHFRDPGLEYKEDIRSGSLAAVAGGITSACSMANTKPCVDNVPVAQYIVNKANEVGLIEIFPYAAATKGMKGEELTEMGDLLENGGVGGFSDDGRTIMNAEVMRRALEYAKHFDSFVASHAIDVNLEGRGDMHEGKVSASNGLNGIPAESENVIAIRDMLVAKLAKSHVHICHISSKTTVDLLRWAKSEGINATGEAAPHHFTLTEEACRNYNTNAKMSPPLRTEEDIEGILQGLKDGTIDCIATDHAPHQEDEKLVEFAKAPNGIIGFQTAIPLTIKRIEDGTLTWQDFARLMSYNPAKILKKDYLGEIKAGKQADIAIINDKLEYIFTKEMIKSKSTNSPFLDEKLKGLAVMTFKKGKVVYKYEG